jgi:hypothetical protein
LVEEAWDILHCCAILRRWAWIRSNLFLNRGGVVGRAFERKRLLELSAKMDWLIQVKRVNVVLLTEPSEVF